MTHTHIEIRGRLERLLDKHHAALTAGETDQAERIATGMRHIAERTDWTGAKSWLDLINRL